MRNGLPLVYTLLRVLWSSIHVILVAVALGMITIWFLHDDQGMELITSLWTTLTDLQRTIANVITFPWGG